MGTASTSSAVEAPEAGAVPTASAPRGLRWALLTALLLWNLVVHWPGYYSPDTINMMWQNSGRLFLNDWHSPLLRDLFGLITFGAAGQVELLFVAQLALLAAVFLLYTRVVGTIGLLVFTLLLALPPSLTMIGFVGKDTLAALALVGLGALVLRATDPRGADWRTALGLLGFTALLVAIRPNTALLALGAAPVLGGLLMARRHGRHSGRSAGHTLQSTGTIVVGAGAIVGLTVALTVLSMVRAGSHTAAASVQRGWDIAAVSIATGRNLLPAAVAPAAGPCSLPQLRSQYSPSTSGYLMLIDGRCAVIPLPKVDPPPAEQGRVGISLGQWWQVASAHPGPYLAHRLAAMAAMAGLNGPLNDPYHASSASYADTIGIDPAEVAPLHTAVYTRLDALARWAPSSMMWRPWSWAVLAIVAGAGLIGTRYARPAAWLTAGLVAYLASMFLLSPSSDVRYLSPIWSLALLFTPLAAQRLTSSLRRRRTPAGVRTADTSGGN